MTKKPVSDAAWKQSEPGSCGAASLMVALADLNGEGLSREREFEIWRFANNHSKALPGSFPGRLALYAQAHGCRSEIYEDHGKLEAVLRLSTEQTRFPGLDPAKALEEHEVYLREAEGEGIAVMRGELSLERVVDLAAKGPVLMLVSTGPDVSGLHWVLLKNYDPEGRICVLMEPG